MLDDLGRFAHLMALGHLVMLEASLPAFFGRLLADALEVATLLTVFACRAFLQTFRLVCGLLLPAAPETCPSAFESCLANGVLAGTFRDLDLVALVGTSIQTDLLCFVVTLAGF